MRPAVLLALVALLAAGCSGSSKPKPPGQSATTTSAPSGAGSPATTSTLSPAAAAALRRAAQSAVLRPSDMPQGWAATPAAGQASASNLSTCLKIDPSVLSGPISARSSDFTYGPDSVSTSVVYANSLQAATAAFPKFTGHRLWVCVRAVVAAALDIDPAQAILGFQPVQVAMSSKAERTAATRFSFTVLTGEAGVQVPAHIDVIFVQEGRVTAELEFSGAAVPVDPALEQRVLDTVSGRLIRLPDLG